jgi:hypothetical protein
MTNTCLTGPNRGYARGHLYFGHRRRLVPEDVTVVDEMDTFTRVWSISSGTYSSRLGLRAPLQ